MPLTYHDRGTSGTQIEVRSSAVSVCFIRKEMFSAMAGGGARWRYMFKFSTGPEGFIADGQAGTFEEAKAAVEQHWAAWLAAAGLKEM